MGMPEKKTPFIEPPEELRCQRNDGKSWRCNHWRIHKQIFCEEHYLYYKAKLIKQNAKKPKASSSALPKHDGEENERDVPAKRRREKSKRLREEEEAPLPEEKARRIKRNETVKVRAERKCRKEEEEDSEGTVPLDRKVRLREKIKRLLQSIERDDGDEEEEEETITRGRRSSSKIEKPSSSKSEKPSVARSCHQCQKNDKRIVRCQNCNAKRYCVPCIRRWYRFKLIIFSLFAFNNSCFQY